MKELWTIMITQQEDDIYSVYDVIMIDTEENVNEAVEILKQEETIIDAVAERVNYYN